MCTLGYRGPQLPVPLWCVCEQPYAGYACSTPAAYIDVTLYAPLPNMGTVLTSRQHISSRLSCMVVCLDIGQSDVLLWQHSGLGHVACCITCTRSTSEAGNPLPPKHKGVVLPVVLLHSTQWGWFTSDRIVEHGWYLTGMYRLSSSKEDCMPQCPWPSTHTSPH